MLGARSKFRITFSHESQCLVAADLLTAKQCNRKTCRLPAQPESFPAGTGPREFSSRVHRLHRSSCPPAQPPAGCSADRIPGDQDDPCAAIRISPHGRDQFARWWNLGLPVANISDARGLGISIGRLVALDLFWICGACIFLVFRRLRSRWLLGIVRIFLFLGPDGCLSYRLSYCLAGLVG